MNRKNNLNIDRVAMVDLRQRIMGSTWCIKCSSDKKANEKEYAEYIYKGNGYCEECYQGIRKLLNIL